MSPELWAIVGVSWLTCAFLGGLIGARREAILAGAVTGLAFGPIGVLAAFALDGRSKCSLCGTRLDRNASVCPGCQRSFEPVGTASKQAIEFNCQDCGETISVSAENAGLKVACANCNKLAQVPNAGRNLHRCPDCGKQISKRAEMCPHCGCPAEVA